MKTILILILIHYVLLLVRKNKNSSVLSCGLFGWVGSSSDKFSKDKFDKLGMYNVERGKHSCGVAVNGELYKGIGVISEYQDYIIKNTTPHPKESTVVIGHTRHATVGKHTISAAHPFKFDYGEEGYFIGAHNGTLKNYHQIAREYGIDATGKIDSQILLEIISKDDANIKVLEQYYGAAALLMHSSENPDTMYLFRGKSKQDTFTNTYERDERPLYYWQENDGSMYISSLKDSLLAIINVEEDKKNIFEVAPNRIYEIKAGKIVKKCVIDRSNVIDYYETKKKEFANTTKPKSTTNSRIGYNRTLDSNSNDDMNTNDHAINNLFYEKKYIKNTYQEINFNKLRWFDSENKRVSGIHIFIDQIGYVKIGDDINKLKSKLSDFSFLDSSLTQPENINFGNIEDADLFYFHNGVLLETEEDYMFCLNPSLARKKEPTFEDYSDMSVHPIIDLDRIKKEDVITRAKQAITKDSKMFSGQIIMAGSYVVYTVHNGILTKASLKDEMIEYDSANFNTLDIFENASITSSKLEDEEEDDVEDSTFEEEINSMMELGSIDEIDTVFEVMSNFDAAIESVQELKEYKSNSKLTNMIIEFTETLENGLKPISEAVNSINQNV